MVMMTRREIIDWVLSRIFYYNAITISQLTDNNTVCLMSEVVVRVSLFPQCGDGRSGGWL